MSLLMPPPHSRILDNNWAFQDSKMTGTLKCVVAILNTASLSLQEAGFTGFMRSLRGRDQEKVVKRKEDLWEPHAGRGDDALWPLILALSALMWEIWWPQLKAFFLLLLLSCRGDSICNDTSGSLVVRPTTQDFFFLSWISWWAKNKQKGFVLGFFFGFFLLSAQSLWLNMWKTTPYTVSMQ